jgi:DNA polymerase family A
VRRWQERVRAAAQRDSGLHRVHTMLGRHRSLPGYAKGKRSKEAARASRAAINTPIQGSAADVVAAAMVRIHDDPRLRELGWRMLLQVHDEVRAPAGRLWLGVHAVLAVLSEWSSGDAFASVMQARVHVQHSFIIAPSEARARATVMDIKVSWASHKS